MYAAGKQVRVMLILFLCSTQEAKRRIYDTLIERVFRSEEKKQDSRVSKSDLDALEKEISIDIADLRRDIRRLKKDLFKSPAKRLPTPKHGFAKKSPNELTVNIYILYIKLLHVSDKHVLIT